MSSRKGPFPTGQVEGEPCVRVCAVSPRFCLSLSLSLPFSVFSLSLSLSRVDQRGYHRVEDLFTQRCLAWYGAGARWIRGTSVFGCRGRQFSALSRCPTWLRAPDDGMLFRDAKTRAPGPGFGPGRPGVPDDEGSRAEHLATHLCSALMACLHETAWRRIKPLPMLCRSASPFRPACVLASFGMC